MNYLRRTLSSIGDVLGEGGAVLAGSVFFDIRFTLIVTGTHLYFQVP
jgi:hypothetical protein